MVFASSAEATGWTVGSGSTVSLGDGKLVMGCDDLEIAAGATLEGEQGTIDLAGSWYGSGGFMPGTSSVNLVDGACVPNASTLAGDNSFYNLDASTGSGKQLDFASNSIQTVLNSLSLSGAAGNLLAIRSTIAGQEALLDLSPGGTQFIDFVDVQDNHATGQALAPGPPAAFNSVDSGNSLGWFQGVSVIEVPTVSEVGAATLALLLAMLGLWWIPRRRTTA